MRLITEFDSYALEREAFRIIRTNLQYSTAGRSPQIVMMTSCFPAEGKSTVAVNTAISLAGLGEKTLIMDADLKLPTVHRTFELPKAPGLTDILIGKNNVAETIRQTGIENLDFLPAGPQSPNPVELLESRQMNELLASLRKEYRYIVMDAAPLYGLSDSFVTANKADGVCLVASIGKSRLDVLRRVVSNLRMIDCRLLGVIFNNQTTGRLPMRYGAGYGYTKKSGYGKGYRDSRRGRYDRHKDRQSDQISKM